MEFRNESGNSAYDGAGRLNHALWRNKKFRALEAEYKLAVIYIIAGPEFSPSGIFTLDPVSVGEAISSVRVPNDPTFWSFVGRRALVQLVEDGLIEYQEPVVVVHGVREFYAESGIPGVKDQIDRDVAKIADSAILEHYKAFYGLDDSAVETRENMFYALVDVMNVDPTLNQQELEDYAAKLVGAGYTHEQVTMWYGRGGWWYESDWRGKRGQYPTIHGISDTINLASIGYTVPTKTKLDKNSVVETVKRLQRGKSRLEAKDIITGLHGGKVWASLIANRKWGDWKSLDSEQTKFAVYEALRDE